MIDYAFSHQIFEGVEPEVKKALAEKARKLKMEKGDCLFDSGDEVKNLYFLQSGWLKLSTQTVNGDVAVTDIIGEGSFMGWQWLLADGKFPCSAIAADDCLLVSIPADVFSRELANSHKLTLNILRNAAEQHNKAQHRIEHMALQDAGQKVGCFLLQFSHGQQEGGYKFRLPFEKSLIAARLGIKPETFSRALAQLKNIGISVNNDEITVADVKKLENHVCTACSSVYPCTEQNI